ncbi:MAG: hypothetical protein WBL06_09590, partial [Pseudolysinimonas sp.]|uniref:DivIVA domain-containing protein n=1 Tax=Pseudolysinimonas sp. TaxID=2680009 RepID=UPI003C76D384
MASEDTGFSTELRGYKKDEVDSVVSELRRDLIKANAEKTDQTKEIKRLQAVTEDLQAELDEVGSPTYSGLGTKLENTLRVAEEQSTRLISQADIDAERMRQAVQQEIDSLRAEAAAHVDSTVSEARAEAERTVRDARDEADAIISAAQAEAETARQDGLREAAALRG